MKKENKWYWMSFEREHYPGNMMDYLNKANAVDFKVLFEKNKYVFVMLKIK